MISLIICSRQPDIPKELKDNIQKTIGVEYELIVIDNSENKHTIFSAYNQGVLRAQYPYLCFAHDDVRYHTQFWGKRVIDHFSDNNVGLIGVLGTHFMPRSCAYWFYTNMHTGIYIQDELFEDKIIPKLVRHLDYIKNKKSIEAVVVDGLWFCIPKIMFDSIEFDVTNFKGYHGYDMDICLQIREKKKQVVIISDIIIEHKNLNGIQSHDLFLDSMIALNNKWKDYLPQYAGVVMTTEEEKIREIYLKSYFELVVEYNKSLLEVKRLSNSKAYKIGKLILKPFSYFSK